MDENNTTYCGDGSLSVSSCELCHTGYTAHSKVHIYTAVRTCNTRVKYSQDTLSCNLEKRRCDFSILLIHKTRRARWFLTFRTVTSRVRQHTMNKQRQNSPHAQIDCRPVHTGSPAAILTTAVIGGASCLAASCLAASCSPLCCREELSPRTSRCSPLMSLAARRKGRRKEVGSACRKRSAEDWW